MFFSIITHLFKSNKNFAPINFTNPQEDNQSIKILEDSIIDFNGILLHDFMLFHHNNNLLIDLLLFLPHYGLYFGEKISWKADELKGASIALSSKHHNKSSTTRLSVTQRILHQKLEDVLSFDSTPIERFFWMEHLSEAEFDSLHSSFHTHLCKERLIFSDDTVQTIQKKLSSLSNYQEDPCTKLKVLGSLQAHTLLLPTKKDPFGLFLSDEQQTFLYTPLVNGSITLLNGDYATGKSSVLIRKVLHQLLTDPNCKATIITPTLLSGEILRKEFIALCDFAAVTLDNTRLTFLNPPTPRETIGIKALPQDSSMIVYDGFYNLDEFFIEQLYENIKKQSIFISSQIEYEKETSYTLQKSYRIPAINTIQFSHSKVAMLDFLIVLQELFETKSMTPILVILPSHTLLLEYKKAIDSHLKIECQLLNPTFSLQYKNLDPITLSTPEYLSGISVPLCYIIHLKPETAEYRLGVSRASHSVTVITENNSISQ